MSSLTGSHQREIGTITVNVGVVDYHSNSSELKESISFFDLSVEIIHGNNIQILLKHKSKDIVFSTHDERIVDLLQLKGFHQAQEIHAQLNKQKKQRKLILSTIILVPFFFILLMPVVSFFISDDLYNEMISIEILKPLGETLLNEAKANKGKAAVIVEGIANKIKRNNPQLEKIPFEFYVSSSREVNAFALPGGKIIVNRGLIEKINSIGELYGVLAHEMAHVEQRHVLKTLIAKLTPMLGVVALEFMFPNSSKLSYNLISIADLGYSKEVEQEADEVALKYLSSSRIGSDGLRSFFHRLQQDESLFSTLLSTHPSSTNRIEMIDLFMSENPYRFEPWDENELEQLKKALDH